MRTMGERRIYCGICGEVVNDPFTARRTGALLSLDIPGKKRLAVRICDGCLDLDQEDTKRVQENKGRANEYRDHH